MFDRKLADMASKGRKINAKALVLLIRLTECSPMRLIQAGFGHTDRHDQNPENEKYRVGHVSLENLFHGQDREQV